ncbi:hypothetical protein [Kribbella sancticallisti]|uniref:hypothetical protein n=1 Tax=Kribbella sancticallisti TaxID=460087 RepID=UPI0031DFB7CE
MGATFDWHTHGLAITSTVYEIVPGSRIVWGELAQAIDGIHVWTFKAVADGTLITTEESWSGPPVDANQPTLQSALDASLTSWLEHLKTTVES